MSRRASKLALAIWAAACALLVLPASARAFVLPVCEPDLALSASPDAHPATPGAEPGCSEASRHDPERESRLLDEIQAELEAQAREGLGALCDERGASLLAPPRVRPVEDARIDAPPCSKSGKIAAIAPPPDEGPRDGPALERAAFDPALLPDGLRLPAAPEPALFDPLERGGAVRPGFARAIEHPPR